VQASSTDEGQRCEQAECTGRHIDGSPVEVAL